MRKTRLWIWGVGALVVLGLLAANLMLQHRRSVTAEDMSLALRQGAMQVTAKDLGLTVPEGSLTAYGVVADVGRGEDSVTLVAFSTGDASLHFPHGGGIVGGHTRPIVREAVGELMVAAQAGAAGLPASTSTATPKDGQVRITLLTNQGLRAGEASEAAVAKGDHRLSDVYAAANQVIAALRQGGQF